MRLLVLNHEYPPLGGGASPVTAALCRHLAERGHELDVVTMGFGDLPVHEVNGRLRIYRVPCRRSRKEMSTTRELATYLLPAYRQALALAAQQPYDIIHTHFILPNGLVGAALVRRLRIPHVITIHGSDVPGYNPHRFRLEHRMLPPLWRWVLRSVDVLVSPSQALLDMAAAAAPHGRLPSPMVLPYGISPLQHDFEAKIPNRVLMSGRLLERKGFRVALEALRLHPMDVDLHIIGDGPDRDLLLAMAKGLCGSVTFHGWLDARSDEYRDLFRTAALFAFPSEMDNFPVVLLEAMAAGLAIITTRAGGCPEVVGDTAEFVAVRDADGLGRALQGLLADPARCRAMGQAAQARATARYAWPTIARQYETLFADIIARHGSQARV